MARFTRAYTKLEDWWRSNDLIVTSDVVQAIREVIFEALNIPYEYLLVELAKSTDLEWLVLLYCEQMEEYGYTVDICLDKTDQIKADISDILLWALG